MKNKNLKEAYTWNYLYYVIVDTLLEQTCGIFNKKKDAKQWIKATKQEKRFFITRCKHISIIVK